jgi:hypothetical protein
MPDRDPTPSEDLESLLAVYLLDLRGQYEGQLRALTTAQRAMEEYRAADGPEKRIQTLSVLKQQFQLLRASNTAVADGLTEAEREVALLEDAQPT